MDYLDISAKNLTDWGTRTASWRWPGQSNLSVCIPWHLSYHDAAFQLSISVLPFYWQFLFLLN